jgi:hypothetical protein
MFLATKCGVTNDASIFDGQNFFVEYYFQY